MRIQVVHCHPLTDSYNHALFQVVLEGLAHGGHDAIGTDLYRDGFEAAMTPPEHRSYYPGPYEVAAVSAYVDTLRNIDGIIFCFPHWWFAMPAMRKGYIDRVWGPGIAFDHDMAGGRIKPLLTHIRLFGVVTSYGSPWWVTRFVAGDPGRKVLMRALKPMCGPSVRSFYLAHYDMDRSTPKSRQAFIERARRVASRI
jgi:putative NADPH-quinone reductase